MGEAADDVEQGTFAAAGAIDDADEFPLAQVLAIATIAHHTWIQQRHISKNN